MAIIEMMRSTGLKPYLEKLDTELAINHFEKKFYRKWRKCIQNKKTEKSYYHSRDYFL